MEEEAKSWWRWWMADWLDVGARDRAGSYKQVDAFGSVDQAVAIPARIVDPRKACVDIKIRWIVDAAGGWRER